MVECEAIFLPLPDASLEEGIGGIAMVAPDCFDSCCTCAPVGATISVFVIDDVVTNDARARAVIAAAGDDHELISIDERYEEPLPPGMYLGCTTDDVDAACVTFDVEPARLTTVNVLRSRNGDRLLVFAPDGTEEHVSFRVTPAVDAGVVESDAGEVGDGGSS